MVKSLKTPLGEIIILLDNKDVEFQVEQIFSKRFPEVTTYHLKYKYTHDEKEHMIKCLLNGTNLIGDCEGGERIETVAFDSTDPFVRLSIGVEGQFRTYFYNENDELVPYNEPHELFDG